MSADGDRDLAGWTLERHILEEQRTHQGATGEFTRLFQQLALAGKIIASRVNQAGLAGVLGVTGEVNVQAVIARADQALYRAKDDGRNCVRIAAETAPLMADETQRHTRVS